MKKYFSKTGITLVELIVATMLMTIVLMGMFAIDNVFNNNNQDYGQKYLVKSATQTTLSHILNNASLSEGADAIANQEAILIGNAGLGAGANNANSFCFHQGGTGSGFNNIAANAGDIWLCYTFYPAGTAVTATTGPNEIFYCTMGYTTGGIDPRGATNCSAVANSQFLGTAFSIAPSFNTTGGFSITIQNCLDDSAAGTCFSATPNPAANPEVTLTGSVFPPQVSTN